MSVELRPLADGDAGWLAELHNRAFADYPVPAVLDASSLAFYMDETDVRPELSFAAHVDGRPASFCLGAIRGGRPASAARARSRFRRRGLGAGCSGHGRCVAPPARAGRPRGDRRQRRPPAAVRALGFVRRRRRPHACSRPPPKGAPDRRKPRLEPLDTDQAVGRSTVGLADAPWQLQPESLPTSPPRPLATGGRLGRRRERRFWLYGLAVDPALAGGDWPPTLAALNAESLAVPALVPEDWVALHAFLRAVGAEHEPSASGR